MAELLENKHQTRPNKGVSSKLKPNQELQKQKVLPN